VEVIEEANALAYYDTATITAVNSFIVQPQEQKTWELEKSVEVFGKKS
jgi:hypothetical protein